MVCLPHGRPFAGGPHIRAVCECVGSRWGERCPTKQFIHHSLYCAEPASLQLCLPGSNVTITPNTCISHLQLLPSVAFPRYSTAPRPVPEGSRASATPLSFYRGGICGHARAHSSADQRTGEGRPLSRDEGHQAALRAHGVAQTPLSYRPDRVLASGRPRTAEEILRLQCVE